MNYALSIVKILDTLYNASIPETLWDIVLNLKIKLSITVHFLFILIRTTILAYSLDQVLPRSQASLECKHLISLSGNFYLMTSELAMTPVVHKGHIVWITVEVTTSIQGCLVSDTDLFRRCFFKRWVGSLEY